MSFYVPSSYDHTIFYFIRVMAILFFIFFRVMTILNFFYQVLTISWPKFMCCYHIYLFVYQLWYQVNSTTSTYSPFSTNWDIRWAQLPVHIHPTQPTGISGERNYQYIFSLLNILGYQESSNSSTTLKYSILILLNRISGSIYKITRVLNSKFALHSRKSI